MGFFGTLKVMKDIVKGGIETYQADEKLDALLKTVETEHGGALTAEEQALLKKYKTMRAEYDERADAMDTDAKNDFSTRVTDSKLAFLESLQENPRIPEELRGRLKFAVNAYKDAENLALDSLEETLADAAETDEQRASVRKATREAKRK